MVYKRAEQTASQRLGITYKSLLWIREGAFRNPLKTERQDEVH